MTTEEALSRLLAGDLPQPEAAAWRSRIDTEPDVAVAWAALLRLDADLASVLTPPPGANARILERHTRRHARRRSPWLGLTVGLAAGVLLGLGLASLQGLPPVDLTLHDDALQVRGRAHLQTDAARIEVDGEAIVSPGDVEVTDGRAIVRTEGRTRTLGRGDRLRLDRPLPAPPPPVSPERTDTGRVAELELQVRLLEEMLEAQQIEYEGVPVPWPDDLPEALKPDAFRSNLERAVAECAPDVELLGFDCSEPPCLAQLRTPASGWWDRLVNDCPHFTDVYTSAVTTATSEVTCPDGGKERMRLLGWSWHVVQDTHPLDDEAKANHGKRFSARIRENTQAWPCQNSEVP